MKTFEKPTNTCKEGRKACTDTAFEKVISRTLEDVFSQIEIEDIKVKKK